MPIHTRKHCRETPEPEDGTRIHTMRFWPRGARRERFDAWMRELAPSAELLRWCWAEQEKPALDMYIHDQTWARPLHRRDGGPEAPAGRSQAPARGGRDLDPALYLPRSRPLPPHRLGLADPPDRPVTFLTSDNLQLSEPNPGPWAPATRSRCAGAPTAALQYLSSAVPEATRRAYESDLRHFYAWGGTIPATELMVPGRFPRAALQARVRDPNRPRRAPGPCEAVAGPSRCAR